VDPITAAQTLQVAAWVHGLTPNRVPESVKLRHKLVLADLLTVSAAGAQLLEYQKLLSVWPKLDGPVPIPGVEFTTNADTAAWIFGTTAVALELDEGSKFAKGHPGSHVIPAVLSLAADIGARGEDAMLAIIAGYEVSARYGQATALHAGVHPHGNWGIVGAAAACAKLSGLDPDAIATAMDHASGMVLATAFTSALDGNLVRNSWMGATATSALASVRLAQAGIAANTGTADATLGGTLGDFSPEILTVGLGEVWEVEKNYFKRHAACAFTHPPIDAALKLRDQLRDSGINLERDSHRVREIRVDSHYLAVGLNGKEPQSRLSAMFSIPYVIAVALIDGEVTPRQHDSLRIQAEAVRVLASKVSVVHDEEFSRRLPHYRGASVHIWCDDDSEFSCSVDQPIGDSDFRPLGEGELIAKGESLISPEAVARMWEYAEAISSTPDIRHLSPLLTKI
jgi:2-methylcitrate dehydratase PrpD